MDIQDRIVYDGNELIQIMESYLDRFKVFQFDHRYRELLGDKLIRKIGTWETNIRKIKDQPLTLVVCGEFKRGKSSLINAILGEDVVTTDITTETITTNKISYGAHKNEILLSGGKRMVISDDELKHDKLKEIMSALKEEVTRLELQRPIEILKQVTIIDTPGLEDSSKDFSADVEQALAQADAVVYIFSVAYPLSINEQLFIKTAIKPQKHTELFLVGNMVDMLDDEESYNRVKEMLKGRLENVLPGETPLMLSALDELCRQKGAKRPNDGLAAMMETNFRNFRDSLTQLLESKKDCILPDRIQRLLSGMIQDLTFDLDALEQGVSMDLKAVSAEMDKLNEYKTSKVQEQLDIEKRIDRLIELLYAETQGWISEFISKMEADVDSLGNIPAEDIKKYYVLYCIDTLQEAVQRCMEHSTIKLYAALDTISEEISRKTALKMNTVPVLLSFSLQNKTWTKGDNVALASIALGMSAGILGIAMDYVAGSMRQKQVRNSQEDLTREIRAQYSTLQISMSNSLSETFKNLKANAKEQIGVYFEEHIQTLESQVEQSAMVARQDDAKKHEIRAAIEAVKAIIDEIRENIAFQ